MENKVVHLMHRYTQHFHLLLDLYYSSLDSSIEIFPYLNEKKKKLNLVGKHISDDAGINMRFLVVHLSETIGHSSIKEWR